MLVEVVVKVEVQHDGRIDVCWLCYPPSNRAKHWISLWPRDLI